MQRSDKVLKEQFITLVRDINSENTNTVEEITRAILYNIMCEFKTTDIYLALLYKLIFQVQKDIACQLLCGFIKFGQSESGTPFKPMLDYFVIEAFKCLLKIHGWSLLKPCVLALRDKVTNYLNDPLFKFIVKISVAQLKEDERTYGSDLCYNLPREKSFTWGWFSYEIAGSFYADLNRKENNAKHMRNVMMLYRKLITQLRQNVVDIVPIIDEIPAMKIEESWSGIVTALAEYKWAGDLINKVMDTSTDGIDADAIDAVDAYATEGASDHLEVVWGDSPREETQSIGDLTIVVDPLEATPLESTPLEAISIEATTLEATPLESTPLESISIESTPLAESGVVGGVPLEGAPPQKGWLYSLFGWA